MDAVRIILKSGKEQSVRRFHPWVFSGAIKKIQGNPVEGDIVEVYDNKNSFLAIGHYQPASIAVRILSFDKIKPDKEFFRERLKNAITYRKVSGLIGNPSFNVFRLIHGEGDNLPGLIVDFYNGVAVMQFYSAGMYRIRTQIADLLRELLADMVTAVYDKSESTIPYLSGIKPVNGFVDGNADQVVINEYGFKFRVDLTSGQKTGFFIDQRENRSLLLNYSGGKTVLNMFGYTGGFSVYSLKDAREVHTVDSSSPAIDLAEENVRLNYGNESRHKSFRTDAFEFLREMGNDYDLIILDPPAFARHSNVLANALQGYKRLNMKAIEHIKPGGIIFTFSCSQVVSQENFRKSVFAAAANTGRKVRLLHQMGQPPDHPVNIYHPESEYLKGLVLYVE